MLKLVIDENISFAKEAFENYGKILLLNGREINNEILKDADVLLVRSITKVDEKLLSKTKVKFVGTATIGTDHIDKEYLTNSRIYFTDAKGCSADAVAEFVFCGLLKILNQQQKKLNDLTIGIVGVGNIGRRVESFAKMLGMKVKLNDPPLKRLTSDKKYIGLDEALQSDIITFHIPLNKSGIDKTFHLLDEKKLNLIKNNSILVNTSRGEVIDNNALLSFIDKKNLSVVLDVWENEPNINSALLQKINYGTCHIAGYSFEGKINGTKILYDKFCDYFKLEKKWLPVFPKADNSLILVSSKLKIEELLNNIFSLIYNIENDDKKLREIKFIQPSEIGKYFDKLRKEYAVRREFSNYTIKIEPPDEYTAEILKRFRFKVI